MELSLTEKEWKSIISALRLGGDTTFIKNLIPLLTSKNKVFLTKKSSVKSTVMSSNHFKYNEDELLNELRDYIVGTYNAHYLLVMTKSKPLISLNACGDAESFCRSNILKYASRYDKKGTARRDIIKILHYEFAFVSTSMINLYNVKPTLNEYFH